MGKYSKSKKCREKSCQGIVKLSAPVTVRTGYTASYAYPCNVCGRLYWFNGRNVSRVIKTNGKKAFMPVFKLN